METLTIIEYTPRGDYLAMDSAGQLYRISGDAFTSAVLEHAKADTPEARLEALKYVNDFYWLPAMPGVTKLSEETSRRAAEVRQLLQALDEKAP